MMQPLIRAYFVCAYGLGMKRPGTVCQLLLQGCWATILCASTTYPDGPLPSSLRIPMYVHHMTHHVIPTGPSPLLYVKPATCAYTLHLTPCHMSHVLPAPCSAAWRERYDKASVRLARLESSAYSPGSSPHKDYSLHTYIPAHA